MKRFLSIDFDYFIDCDMKTRTALFPKLDETSSISSRISAWKDAYNAFGSELSTIPVLSDDYQTLLSMINHCHSLCMIRDSHKFIYNFIMKHTDLNEKFEVYNIDFHHDMYHFRSKNERVNCGNWVNMLKEDRPFLHYY